MSRFAKHRRVFYFEEPLYDAATAYLETRRCPLTQVTIVTPHLPPHGTNDNAILQELIQRFARAEQITEPITWFYTPMALEFFPKTILPSLVVYDCMDELSMFRGAPASIQILEEELLRVSDLVFTGGVSLFEAKRSLHKAVHAFPSGVEAEHFGSARSFQDDFAENASLPRPRLGFAGVIDERMDLNLVDEVARQRPDWQLVMIGPVTKIDSASLPARPNIHWLGRKEYADLPKYFAGWDVALMPFALNDSTRFISPTKTPEYLCAGLPVVSTPIRDVVRPYGNLGLVRIAETPEQFILATEQALMGGMCLKWRERADQFLKSLSWDSVWESMNHLIAEKQERAALGLAAAAQSRRAAHV